MNCIYLSIFRNAFDHKKNRENRQLEIIPGMTIKNYLNTCFIPDDWQVYYCSSSRNVGKVLKPEEIENIVPLDGDGLVIMPKIAGGGDGGKNILSVVASIGLMMASMGVGSLVAGGSFMSSGFVGMTGWGFWSYAASIGVQMAGGYLVSQMTPTPKVPELQTESPTYGWNIQSTQGEGNAISFTFGTVRTGGQLLNAHVTYDGEKQYLNLLYSGGEGPCDYTGNGENENCTGIDEILINGNPASNYSDLEIYKRAGLNNQSVIPNFNDTYAEENVSTELVLGSDWTTKTTTSTAAQGLEVVIQLPALFKAGNDGRLKNASVQVQIDYKLNSAAEWTTLDTPTISGATSKPLYRVYRVDNVTIGQYDVRCKCIAKSGTDTTYSNTVNWYTLSAISYEDFQRPNLVLLALKALATDQLSGGMPTVTWEQIRSKGWIYNPHTSVYEEKLLTTPAWACYDMISRIKKYYNINTSVMDTVVEGIAVNRMDYDAFNEAATYQEEVINSRQRCLCNYILDETKTLWEALKELESVGRFKVIPRGTKYSCIVDKPVSTPAWMANSANTILDSFSEQFSDIAKRANSVEVRFRNKDNNYDWDTAVINADDYDDAATVPNPIQVTLAACTDWDHAYLEGAYLLRQNQLLTRTITSSHDIDAIGVQIGEVYYFQSDVTDWGKGGRIIVADANSISIDQQVYLASGKTYEVIIQHNNDTIEKRTVKGYVQTALFGMALGEGGQFSDVWVTRLDVTEPFTTTPAADEKYTFGETSISAKPFRVISITRDGDLKRKITGIEYVDALYEELADIPTPDYVTKAEITSLTVSEHTDNTGIVWLDVSWMPPRDVYNGARVEINGKKVADIKGFETSYSWQVEALGSYTVKVVTIDIFGNDAGDASKTYTVVGETAPGDVTDLDIAYKGDQVYLTWDIVEDPRSISYEIRKGIDINSASSLGRTTTNEYPIMGDGTYWVAAYYRTLYGVWKGVTVENSLDNTNVVAQYNELESGWQGTCVDTVIDELYFDDIENFDAIVSLDNSLKQLKLSSTATLGYYTIAASDIIDVLYEAKCTIIVDLGAITPSGTAAIVQINVGNNVGAYSGWTDFDNSQKYVGRYFNFRIKLTSETVGIIPIVSAFSFVVDMPDIKEYGNDVSIPTAKTTIIYTKTYHSIPSFIPFVLDSVVGDTITVTNKTLTSVDVEITNSGSYVAREIDYLVRGY
jgi:predicted phage tail protein